MNGASGAERLRALLRQRGFRRDAPVEHHASIGSTSDRLKELARLGAAEGSVVVADSQTAGRGRQGRRWESPAGNLYVSLLLRPHFSTLRVGLLPLAAGVAVAEALEGYGVRAELKWPNDVLLEGRKLAGVLAEAISAGRELEAVVMGIGVNVLGAPAGLEAAALEPACGRRVERLELAASVLARVADWYDALARGEAARLRDTWRARSVPWWGRTVEVGSGPERLRGIARDIDEAGALLLERDGQLVAVRAGEATELRASG